MLNNVAETKLQLNITLYALRTGMKDIDLTAEAFLEILEPENKAYMVEIAKCILEKENVER